MAAARSLRRLLHVLELEEEQARQALEGAVNELRQIEAALASTVERERRGRRLVTASACSGELADRLAGLEEARWAKRRAAALATRIAAAELQAAARRQEFRAKRVERRQTETLIRNREAQDALESGRHGQQALDDWYLNRRHREKSLRARGEEPPA